MHKEEYLAKVQELLSDCEGWTTISSALKARVFCTLHIMKEHRLLEQMLKICDIADIDKAGQLLDLPRQVRQLRTKIKKIELENAHLLFEIPEDQKDGTQGTKNKKRGNQNAKLRKPQKRARPIDKLRRELKKNESLLREEIEDDKLNQDGAVIELIQSASFSGALSRKVCQRLYRFPPDFLEFIMLEELFEAWQRVTDKVHANPKDFSVPYFLAAIHGKKIPEESFIATMRRLRGASESQLEKDFPPAAQNFPQMYLSYASLRTIPSLMASPVVVENLARKIPLGTLIWYFEEMYGRSKACRGILNDRLKGFVVPEETSSKISKVFSYGKLAERLLTFERVGLHDLVDALKPVAKTQLSRLKQSWHDKNQDTKVAVFGDASASMQTAIEAGAIFSSMLSACLDGELSFFASELIPSPHPKPSTVEEMLEVCQKVRAWGCTSLAAALWPYFAEKIWIDTIVMVTDEEENMDCQGYQFAALLKEYQQQVNPNVRLVVVCVGAGDTRFRNSLITNGIQDTKVVTIDGQRPDNTKFSTLLGEIASFSKRQETISSSTEQIHPVGEDFVMVPQNGR